MEGYMEAVSEQQKRMSLPENERGDGDDTVFTEEEIKEKMEYFQKHMDAAPESNESRPVSDFSDVEPYFRGVYTFSDGSVAHVVVRETGITVFKGTKEYLNVVKKNSVEENFEIPYVWKETELPLEKAKEMGQRMLETLGIEGFALSSADKEAAYAGEGMEPVAVGWLLSYKRDFGGYPLVSGVQPSNLLQYGSGDGFMANKQIKDEFLTLFVTEEGVMEFHHGMPKAVVALENPAVELLDWEQVQEKVRQAFYWCLVLRDKEYAYAYSVYKAVLTWYYVQQADSESYYAVPCWIFYYDSGDEWALKEREKEDTMRNALYINAIDGSIIYTEKPRLPER